MFCPNCGQDIGAEETVCPYCGSGSPRAFAPSGPRDGRKRGVSGSAVAALVLGLLSLMCAGFITGIPALVFGIIALKNAKTRAQPGMEKGFGAVGVVTGALGFIASLGILIAIAVPGFLRARENARALKCQENLTKIDGAKEQWALEYRHTNGTPIPDSEAFLNNPNIFGPNGYVRKRPVCPSGGAYIVNAIGEDPECSIGATNAPFTPHVIPGSKKTYSHSPPPPEKTVSSTLSDRQRAFKCIENLAKIDGAKEQWALEYRHTNGTPIPDSEAFLNDPNIFGVNGYVRKRPACPSGGRYIINPIGVDPECTIGSSETPAHDLP